MSDTSRALVLGCVVMLIVALPVGVTAVAAQTTPGISVGDEATASPGDTITAEPGETVTVTVWANASDVSGYQTRLSFDPDVVRVTDVSGSDDFDDPVANIDNEGGSVAFNQIRSSDADSPVLAEVTLEVTGEAGESAALSVDGSETKYASSDGETVVPETLHGVTVSVEEPETATETATETETQTETVTETETEDETATETETEAANETATGTENETETSTSSPVPAQEDSVGDSSDSVDDSSDSVNDSSDSVDDNSDSVDDSSDSVDNDDDSSSGGSSGGDYSSDEPSFSIESVQVNATNGSVGTPVTVSAVVENSGDAAGEFDARLYVDGNETEQSRTVEVDEGESRTVNFSVSFDTPGTYALGVNSVSGGTVTVAENESTATGTEESAATATAESTTTQTATSAATTETAAAETETESGGAGTDGSTPGFGFVASLAAMSLLVCALALREDEE